MTYSRNDTDDNPEPTCYNQKVFDAFLIPFISVFLAEFGDKTQLTILLLTHKTHRHLLLLSGIIAGFLASDILAIITGQFITQILPPLVIKLIAGIIFIGFGLWSLREEKEETEKEATLRNPFLSGFVLMFLGEMGDKTQITTGLLATKYNPYLVLLGSMSALILLSIMAIYLSKLLLGKINKKLLTRVSAIIFILIGLLFIFF